MLDAAPQKFLLTSALAEIGSDIDCMFADALSDTTGDRGRLGEAMRYAATGGGKRLRPLLVVASGGLFGVPRSLALRAGIAVEAIHVHSLIHDDLPCMDDDDLRRGKATVHRAYDEATAVLAGDALHALAFEILASSDTHPDSDVRAQLVVELARAAGVKGMAGGQMLDLSGVDAELAAVTRVQQLKTGALIAWCLDAGALMGYASQEARTDLRGYALCLGLAFQIADDLLDVEGDAATVGKRVGKDAKQGKSTFVSLLGRERARREAELLVDQANAHIERFGEDAEPLRIIAQFAVRRQR